MFAVIFFSCSIERNDSLIVASTACWWKAGHPSGFWLHQQGVHWLYRTLMFSCSGQYTHIPVLLSHTHRTATVALWIHWNGNLCVFQYIPVLVHKYRSFFLNTRFRYYRGFPVEHAFYSVCSPKSSQTTCELLASHDVPHFSWLFLYFRVVHWHQMMMMIIRLGFSFLILTVLCVLLKSNINAVVMQTVLRVACFSGYICSFYNMIWYEARL